jgi:hypothetical protein
MAVVNDGGAFFYPMGRTSCHGVKAINGHLQWET